MALPLTGPCGRLPPRPHQEQVAKIFKDQWQGILNAVGCTLTNGCVEAVNSLIQAVKAKARGYGTIKHLITIAYGIAGKRTHLLASPLNLKTCPQPSP